MSNGPAVAASPETSAMHPPSAAPANVSWHTCLGPDKALEPEHTSLDVEKQSESEWAAKIEKYRKILDDLREDESVGYELYKRFERYLRSQLSNAARPKQASSVGNHVQEEKDRP